MTPATRRGRVAAEAVRRGFLGYLEALSQRGVTQVAAPDLPAEPVLLSYLVAASMIIELSDRQALLAEPDAASRADRRARAAAPGDQDAASLTSTPAPDLRYSPYNPN